MDQRISKALTLWVVETVDQAVWSLLKKISPRRLTHWIATRISPALPCSSPFQPPEDGNTWGPKTGQSFQARLIDWQKKKVVSGRIERDFRIWSARLLPNAWSEAWSQVYIMQNTSVSDCAQQFSKNSEIPSKRWLVSRLTHCRRLSFSLLNRHTRLVQETCTLSFLPKITMRGIHQAPGVRAFGESSGPQAPRYIEVIKSLCASCSRNELPLRYLRNDRYGICGRILRWMVWSEWFALPVGYRRVYAKKRRGKEDESRIMLPSHTVKGRRHDCNRGMMIVT